MANNDHLTKREYYEQYWKCRDFEIKNLWQRSIFLGTFLALCFTGYGAYFGKVFLSDETLKFCVESDFGGVFAKHAIAVFLAVIGIIFSMLWIAMAKGSKAWYETYENAISAIEKEMQCTRSAYDMLTCGFGGCNRKFFQNPEIDDNLFSTKAGAYSPSKINIAIGHVSFIVWSLIFSFHIAVIFTLFYFEGIECSSEIGWLALVCFCIVEILIIIFFRFSRKKESFWDIGSDFLLQNEGEKTFVKRAKNALKSSFRGVIALLKKKEPHYTNNYTKHIVQLNHLELERLNILSALRRDIPMDYVADYENVYLRVPLERTNFKLDLSVDSENKIYAVLKRFDNENFSKKEREAINQYKNQPENEFASGSHSKKNEVPINPDKIIDFLKKIFS